MLHLGDADLLFVDPRTFGEMVVFDPDHVDIELPEVARLGLDPLVDDPDPDELGAVLRRRSTRLKPLLLDQHVIAGIGNIYADEILHAARLHPETPASSLRRRDVGRPPRGDAADPQRVDPRRWVDAVRPRLRRHDGRRRLLPGRPPRLRASRRALPDVRPRVHPADHERWALDVLLPGLPAPRDVIRSPEHPPARLGPTGSFGPAVFLRSLTLKGFKSFAEATTLELEPGVTVVVGPNGSGKSNVVDAIAWVLGAQAPSAVRSQKMDDVIFAGTASRPALGRAEVSLTIDNSAGILPIEFSEVTVKRTLFRSGDSEYAINNVPCRLLDVQELLSDARVGRQQHVIVSQGQIDAVLNARPEDRRAIIEEAAGVLKYRKRKEKAERRLDATEANLLRLQDLLREVRRQLRPLERQAEAAQASRRADRRARRPARLRRRPGDRRPAHQADDPRRDAHPVGRRGDAAEGRARRASTPMWSPSRPS